MIVYHIDAFAERVFKGNPAAIIPLEHWIDASLMQQIAMENNLSETAFIVKSDAGYEIRWFTPGLEIDLCGHATLAAAYVIKNFLEPHLSEILFTTQKAGILRTYIKDGWYTLDFPSRMPEATTATDGLMKSIGNIPVVEVLRSRDYFVVLPDEDAVLNVEPDLAAMKELDAVGVIVTAKGRSADVVSRCFYPAAGIPEDPVTGSAHCNIVPYWAEKPGKEKVECHQVSPRGGILLCERKADRILMSGKCVLFMRGEIVGVVDVDRS